MFDDIAIKITGESISQNDVIMQWGYFDILSSLTTPRDKEEFKKKAQQLEKCPANDWLHDAAVLLRHHLELTTGKDVSSLREALLNQLIEIQFFRGGSFLRYSCIRKDGLIELYEAPRRGLNRLLTGRLRGVLYKSRSKHRPLPSPLLPYPQVPPLPQVDDPQEGTVVKEKHPAAPSILPAAAPIIKDLQARFLHLANWQQDPAASFLSNKTVSESLRFLKFVKRQEDPILIAAGLHLQLCPIEACEGAKIVPSVSRSSFLCDSCHHERTQVDSAARGKAEEE